MRRKILFLFLGVCLFLFVSNLHAMECQIVDEEGNAIYSADAGEMVYFKSTYAYSKSKKMAWNLMVTLPSVDLKNYKTSMKHNGYFFHEGSVENRSRLIPIVIPNESFIEGNATFKYTLTSNGNCYVYLTISQDSEPPSASTLTATAVSTSRIDLSWTACTDNKGVAGYKIRNSNGTHLRTVNGTSTYFDNLTTSTQYCYTVTAHDGAGNESAYSNQACATTLSQDTTAPSVPTLTATAASSSQINLSWTASTDNVGVAGYKIYNGSGSYLASGNGTSNSFTGLNANTQYCYRVKAYDAAGNESGYSNQACATTMGAAQPTYSGTWSFQGTLGLNDCNLSGFSNTVSATNKVSHSGNNVVLVSGTVTLTGTTNDKDGFDVYSPLTTDANGCKSMAGYRYEGASDGNAVAVLVLVVQCGNTQCSLGYGGTSVRQSLNNAISFETNSDSTLNSLMDKSAQQTFEKRPDSSKETLPLDEEGLKATVTDVAKSAIAE